MLTVLAAEFNAELAVWNMRSHRLIRMIKQTDLTQVTLIPGSKMIVTGYKSGQIAVLNALIGAELFRLHPNKGPVLDMGISPDGKMLAIADGNTIQIWDTATGSSLPPLYDPAHKFRFSADSTQIYAATMRGWGGTVRFLPVCPKAPRRNIRCNSPLLCRG